MSKRGSARRVAIIFTCWAVVHSLLASKQVKELVRDLAGVRFRNGLYRFAYVMQSNAFFAWLVWQVLRQPDRELYRVRVPLSWVMYGGQASAIVLGVLGARVIGFTTFGGQCNLQSFLAGDDPGPEPEAQGPPLGSDGEMVAAGPFGLSRHPNNLVPAIFLLLFPRMTENRLTLGVLSVLYAVLGSLHEEYRLRSAYGAAYERYRQRVPFLLGLPRK